MIKRHTKINPIERVVDALKAHGCQPISSCNGWEALCPAHEDHNPSLSVGQGSNGRVLVCCHAGCTAEEIVEAVGLRMSDLMPSNYRSVRYQK